MVLPYINMNPPLVYTFYPSWTLHRPPSPYHPSGSSQCTSPKYPVSCIEPGLATHFIYDIIHVSMSFSQIIPPSPSPTESKRLFYTSVSLLLSHIQGYWRRQWHPTPVLLPGKSHGQRSLVGCSPWVAKSWTRPSDFTFTFHFHALEKEMATHSSILAWRIPRMGSLVGCHLWGRTESDTTEAT